MSKVLFGLLACALLSGGADAHAATKRKQAKFLVKQAIAAFPKSHKLFIGSGKLPVGSQVTVKVLDDHYIADLKMPNYDPVRFVGDVNTKAKTASLAMLLTGGGIGRPPGEQSLVFVSDFKAKQLTLRKNNGIVFGRGETWKQALARSAK